MEFGVDFNVMGKMMCTFQRFEYDSVVQTHLPFHPFPLQVELGHEVVAEEPAEIA